MYLSRRVSVSLSLYLLSKHYVLAHTMTLDCFPVREHTRDSSQDNIGDKCIKRLSNSKID